MPLLEELVCPLLPGEVEGEEELAVDSSADGGDFDVAGLSAESSLLVDFSGETPMVASRYPGRNCNPSQRKM